MASEIKIPPRLHQTIFDMVADGKKQSEIVDWLATQNITVGITAVSYWVKQNKKNQKAIASSIYAAEAAKCAQDDMAILQQNQWMLINLRDKAYADERVSDLIKLTNELKAHVALKVNIIGAPDIIDEKVAADSKDQMMEMLKKFAAAEKTIEAEFTETHELPAEISEK